MELVVDEDDGARVRLDPVAAGAEAVELGHAGVDGARRQLGWDPVEIPVEGEALGREGDVAVGAAQVGERLVGVDRGAADAGHGVAREARGLARRQPQQRAGEEALVGQRGSGQARGQRPLRQPAPVAADQPLGGERQAVAVLEVDRPHALAPRLAAQRQLVADADRQHRHQVRPCRAQQRPGGRVASPGCQLAVGRVELRRQAGGRPVLDEGQLGLPGQPLEHRQQVRSAHGGDN